MNTIIWTLVNMYTIILFLFVEITKAERDKAPKKYETHQEMVKETVAFGRRVDGPPKKVYTPPPSGTFDSFGFENGMCAFYKHRHTKGAGVIFLIDWVAWGKTWC